MHKESWSSESVLEESEKVKLRKSLREDKCGKICVELEFLRKPLIETELCARSFGRLSSPRSSSQNTPVTE